MKKLIVFALAAAAPTLDAQTVAGHLEPNPALPGQTVVFTGTDASGNGFWTPTPCTWFTKVHAGTQDGPRVPIFDVCLQVLVAVGPHGSYQVSWDQRDHFGALVPPGRYWFGVDATDSATGVTTTDWFCLSIQDIDEPALRQLAPAQVGTSVPLEISAPNAPLATYRALASLTSNRPLSARGVDLCLSADPFFHRSVTNPAVVFTNGVGLLDGSGKSSGLTVNIPNDPTLLHLGFHLQAVVSTASGFVTTNDLALTVVP